MKNLVLVAFLVLDLAIVGCASTPTPDPDHGVSNASYRSCLVQTQTNLVQVEAKLADVATADTQAHTITCTKCGAAIPVPPLRPATWWVAQGAELYQTRRLVEATLSGSNTPEGGVK